MFEKPLIKKEKTIDEEMAEKRLRTIRKASPAKKEAWRLDAEIEKIDTSLARLMLDEEKNKSEITKLIAKKVELKRKRSEKLEEDDEYIDPDDVEVVAAEHAKKTNTGTYRIINKKRV